MKAILENLIAVCFFGLMSACGGGGGGSAAGISSTQPSQSMEVISTSFPDKSYFVDPRIKIQFAFNETIGAGGLPSDYVHLNDGSSNVAINLSISGNVAVVTPILKLKTDTNYRLIVKAGITGSNGAKLKNDFVLSFKTQSFVFESKLLVPAYQGTSDNKVAVADVSGDGRQDLIELTQLYRPDSPVHLEGYTLNIFLQNTQGGFDKTQKLEFVAEEGNAYIINFNKLVVLDIDGDGKPEILVPQYRDGNTPVSGLRIFKLGQDGKYAPYSFIPTDYVNTLDVMDVDGDGKLDLVGSQRSSGGFQVMLNTGKTLVLLHPVSLPIGSYEFGVGDFDGDGKPELIVNREYAMPTTFILASQTLFFSQGTAGVFSANLKLTKDAETLCAGFTKCLRMQIIDVNSDGLRDIYFGYVLPALGNREGSTPYLQQQRGGFIKGSPDLYGGSVAIVKDMNLDRLDDLVIIYSSFDGYIYVRVGAGNRMSNVEFSNPFPTLALDEMYPGNVAIADINGDGLPDMILDSYNGGIVVMMQVK